VVFVSDAHFGLRLDEAERRRRATFLQLLESLHGVERLIVAGDLFQFWFDLGRTLPKGYFDILQGLSRLRRTGTHIDYLAGNHDFWRSDFFREELGIETHGEGLELRTQGRQVLVLHGDGVGPGDHGYKLLKRVLRSPLTIGAARLLHPDVLHALARRMDRWSHHHTSRQPLDTARLESAARQSFSRGYDALVLGHVHTQLHKPLDAGELVVIGDWLELFSYVTLEEGTFTLHRWKAPSPA
jgi:UDP-2,3-diacylglucosamine hydrolase